jgi:hypothetical protein
MDSKDAEEYRRDYRKRQREEAAARISRADQEALELMGKRSLFTYGAELGGNHPRSVALLLDDGDRQHGRRHHRRPRVFFREGSQPSAGAEG